MELDAYFYTGPAKDEDVSAIKMLVDELKPPSKQDAFLSAYAHCRDHNQPWSRASLAAAIGIQIKVCNRLIRMAAPPGPKTAAVIDYIKQQNYSVEQDERGSTARSVVLHNQEFDLGWENRSMAKACKLSQTGFNEATKKQRAPKLLDPALTETTATLRADNPEVNAAEIFRGLYNHNLEHRDPAERWSAREMGRAAGLSRKETDDWAYLLSPLDDSEIHIQNELRKDGMLEIAKNHALVTALGAHPTFPLDKIRKVLNISRDYARQILSRDDRKKRTLTRREGSG